MKLAKTWTVLTLLMVFALTVLAASVSLADSRQNNKNMWRNLGIGAGAIGVHGLLRGNGTETLLGAAGAAYSANRYEQDRKSQSADSRYRSRYHRHYYHRSSNGYYRPSRY